LAFETLVKARQTLIQISLDVDFSKDSIFKSNRFNNGTIVYNEIEMIKTLNKIGHKQSALFVELSKI
jgi:hypothetical protein